MEKVLIWGMGSFLNMISNALSQEELKGNIYILGYVSRNKELYGKSIMGRKIISVWDIKNLEYDYIIVANNYFLEVKKEIKEAKWGENIDLKKVIYGEVFKIPYFDFKRYVSIMKKKISLVTETCYGGVLYHSLRLPFYSPFIQTYIQQWDYIRLINNLPYYLEHNIQCHRDLLKTEDININIENKSLAYTIDGYPIAKIEDIYFHCIHAPSYKTYAQKWNERIKRFSIKKMLVMMIIENDQLLEAFLKVPIEKKIGFYYKDVGLSNIIYISEWNRLDLRVKYNYNFRTYIHSLCNPVECTDYATLDICKLLNGEDMCYQICE